MAPPNQLEPTSISAWSILGFLGGMKKLLYAKSAGLSETTGLIPTYLSGHGNRSLAKGGSMTE
jgi:hypothetical protein